MRLGHRLTRWAVGGVVAAGAAGAVLACAGIDTPARLPLVLAFLAAVPALAVASLLGGFDSFARMVVAGTAAIVIDILIAEAMIASGTWSVRTGMAAVALVSVLIAASRPLLARQPARAAIRQELPSDGRVSSQGGSGDPGGPGSVAD